MGDEENIQPNEMKDEISKGLAEMAKEDLVSIGNTNNYKHIAVKPATFARFNSLKLIPRESSDEVLKRIMDLAENVAGSEEK